MTKNNIQTKMTYFFSELKLNKSNWNKLFLIIFSLYIQMEETKRTKSQSKIDRFWNNPTDPRPKLEAESHKKRTRQIIDRPKENRGLLIRKTNENDKKKITE